MNWNLIWKMSMEFRYETWLVVLISMNNVKIRYPYEPLEVSLNTCRWKGVRRDIHQHMLDEVQPTTMNG